MNDTPCWAKESVWKKAAIWVTALSFVVLVILTFDSMAKITAGGSRVPAYTVINKQIDYRYDDTTQRYKPVIGGDQPLFGKALDEAAAERLVALGKKTIQGKNCINCHTLLGNGAYYAPDLTKSWLDPMWVSEAEREKRMLAFLLDPEKNRVGFGNSRRMPNQGLSEEEARGVVAFLKWMSSIDTNGFPHNFKTLTAEK